MTLWPTWFESSVCQTPMTPVTIGIATIPATSAVRRPTFSSGMATSRISRSKNGETTPTAAETTMSAHTRPSRALYGRKRRTIRRKLALRTAGSAGRSGGSLLVNESKRRPGTRRSVPAGGRVWRGTTMSRMSSDTTSPPILELLDWIALRRRSYSETLDAWKTHCPRLSAWEDALADRLVEIRRDGDGESVVVLTAAGSSARQRSD